MTSATTERGKFRLSTVDGVGVWCGMVNMRTKTEKPKSKKINYQPTVIELALSIEFQLLQFLLGYELEVYVLAYNGALRPRGRASRLFENDKLLLSFHSWFDTIKAPESEILFSMTVEVNNLKLRFSMTVGVNNLKWRFFPVLVNGVVCKDAKLVKADDFLYRGLHLMGNTSNNVGSNVTAVTVAELPGLNTLGISMARIDFAPMGINPPHTHPRATEILTVIEGRLLVGFVTSNQLDNRLITKVLEKGDVFVFPQGLIHFQKNLGRGYALAIAGLSSQNPGVITIANAVFGSNPDIDGDILAKAFQVDNKVVNQIQSKF
ncbi:hypothetical protein QVD17_27249 [Tagetes erecta]|uniref:Cupin type-1 domain-containing protein n=1 Tax=Tagetes erecta TaxID=13708 RepID=A0AAD8NJ77_TARER|nr:hypothetical protein QVD17_27249 [Tagetes erecta]